VHLHIEAEPWWYVMSVGYQDLDARGLPTLEPELGRCRPCSERDLHELTGIEYRRPQLLRTHHGPVVHDDDDLRLGAPPTGIEHAFHDMPRQAELCQLVAAYHALLFDRQFAQPISQTCVDPRWQH
jgi:hypothetical protein